MSREDLLRSQRDDVHSVLMPNLPRPLLVAAAQALGMGDGDALTYTDTNQLAVCTDLALYGLPEGLQLVAAYVTSRPDIDPALRAAMPAAAHALFQVGPAGSDGAVPCTPVRGGAPFTLLDPQLRQPEMAGLFVSAYIIPLPGHRITTGTPLAIHPDIVARVKDRPDLRDASLAASLALTQWSYTTPRDTPPAQAPPPTATGRKPSRNAPCHCGSGKRYKACHGRR